MINEWATGYDYHSERVRSGGRHGCVIGRTVSNRAGSVRDLVFGRALELVGLLRSWPRGKQGPSGSLARETQNTL